MGAIYLELCKKYDGVGIWLFLIGMLKHLSLRFIRFVVTTHVLYATQAILFASHRLSRS